VKSHENYIELAQQVAASVAADLRREYSGWASEEQLKAATPSVRIHEVDQTHLIIVIDFPSPAVAIGDEAAFANWGVLRYIDEALDIEELVGIPRRYWFALADDPDPR
jgi:hypothetical protein